MFFRPFEISGITTGEKVFTILKSTYLQIKTIPLPEKPKQLLHIKHMFFLHCLYPSPSKGK